jgi:2'-5' RNA ligase
MARMHLFAALQPPRQVLEPFTDLVSRVRVFEPGPAGPAGQHRGTPGVLGKLLRRGEPEAPAPPEPTGHQLDVVPIARMHLPLARFGNLTQSDAARLTAALRQQAATWPAPRLRLQGGDALPWPGDRSVWLSIAGDVDALGEVARGVPQVAQGLHLFVDRREYRPMIQLGTINGQTTASWLEQLVAELDDLEGNAWFQTAIALLVPSESPRRESPFRVYAEIPLGPPVAH